MSVPRRATAVRSAASGTAYHGTAAAIGWYVC
jgi:hypothetical protein